MLSFPRGVVFTWSERLLSMRAFSTLGDTNKSEYNLGQFYSLDSKQPYEYKTLDDVHFQQEMTERFHTKNIPIPSSPYPKHKDKVFKKNSLNIICDFFDL